MSVKAGFWPSLVAFASELYLSGYGVLGIVPRYFDLFQWSCSNNAQGWVFFGFCCRLITIKANNYTWFEVHGGEMYQLQFRWPLTRRLDEKKESRT